MIRELSLFIGKWERIDPLWGPIKWTIMPGNPQIADRAEHLQFINDALDAASPVLSFWLIASVADFFPVSKC